MAASVPQDTDDTRRAHLAGLVRHPVTLSLGITLAIAALVGATLATDSILIGVAAAAGVFLLVLLIVFFVASSQAKEDFFRSYAEGRGLSRVGEGSLPPGTPLLSRGDKRYAHQIMSGTLPGGAEGAIALYTYEDTDATPTATARPPTSTSPSWSRTSPSRRPASASSTASAGSAFASSTRRRTCFGLASASSSRASSSTSAARSSPAATRTPTSLRQLFEPSFVYWLGDEAPDGIAFELVAGMLCVNVKGHLDSAAMLDRMCEAGSRIAERVREESLETAV